MEQDALGEIANISLGSSATALSQLVGQKVDITTPNISFFNLSEVREEFPKPYVAIEVRYVDGFEGVNLLMIKIEDAAVIADLMMGGEGKPANTELNDLHLSAVQESMNQMMGSAATSMSTIFNMMVNISPPTVDVLDVNDERGLERLQLDEVMVKVSFRLRVGDLIDSSMMQILPVHFAKKMVAKLLNNDVGDELSEESAQMPPASEAPAAQALGQVSAASDGKIETPSGGVMGQKTLHAGSERQRSTPTPVQPAEFVAFQPGPKSEESGPRNLDLLYDIPLEVTVELGRTSKQIREILNLSPGTVVELDKLAGEPVDILVNKKPIAKGEVVVIDENFGVRITEIINRIDRLSGIHN
jgi:flagellar motor switch protein FliN/FliY